MPRWMINCREFAVLVSQRMDRQLSFWDRALMLIHRLLCPPCHCIIDQFDAIRQACRWTSHQQAPPADQNGIGLSEEARARIKDAIKKRCDRSNVSR